MRTPEVFEMQITENGVTVRVDGCFQPTDPDLPGDAPMDIDRARDVARTLALRLGYDGIPPA